MVTERPGVKTAPVILDRPRGEPRTAPRYKVLLHNDDVNDMARVVQALQKVFRFPAGEAVRVMLEAHERGVAVCRVEPLEPAELHRDQLRSAGLGASIEAA
ncbi:MAG: ATP-dependent Clp protease adaptor ClpS [Planctomycetota bacterium]